MYVGPQGPSTAFILLLNDEMNAVVKVECYSMVTTIFILLPSVCPHGRPRLNHLAKIQF